jgi:hypothetical protein
MTYMRNSPIVRTFKKRLVKAFFELSRNQAKHGSPFGTVDFGKLNSLLAVSREVAQAYLMECGVTADYLASKGAGLGGGFGQPGWEGFTPPPYLARPQAMPNPSASPFLINPGTPLSVTLLKHVIPGAANFADDRHWYLTRKTFAWVCGNCDVTETARMLRGMGLLNVERHGHLMITLLPKDRGPVKVFAVRKALASVPDAGFRA